MYKYWQAQERDCHFHDPKEGEEYTIYALKNMIGERWIQVIGFYDSNREGFVYIKPGSLVEVQGKTYDLVHGMPFVLPEDSLRALEDSSVIKFDDNALLYNRKRRVPLRKFINKKLVVKKLLH